jgi:hypothetical protein
VNFFASTFDLLLSLGACDHVVDGTEVGRVQSALLCRSLFDLYIGDDSFDKDAKVLIASNLAPLVSDQ